MLIGIGIVYCTNLSKMIPIFWLAYLSGVGAFINSMTNGICLKKDQRYRVLVSIFLVTLSYLRESAK